VFLKTSFEGGRHKRRTDKINIKWRLKQKNFQNFQ
jgi:ribose 5-phosphate isomerase RpiB